MVAWSESWEIKILSTLAKRLDDEGHNVLLTSTTNTGRNELEKKFQKFKY